MTDIDTLIREARRAVECDLNGGDIISPALTTRLADALEQLQGERRGELERNNKLIQKADEYLDLVDPETVYGGKPALWIQGRDIVRELRNALALAQPSDADPRKPA